MKSSLIALFIAGLLAACNSNQPKTKEEAPSPPPKKDVHIEVHTTVPPPPVVVPPPPGVKVTVRDKNGNLIEVEKPR